MGNAESFFHSRFKKIKRETTSSKNVINDYDLLYKTYKIIEVVDEGTQTELTACYLSKIESVLYNVLKKCVETTLSQLILDTNLKYNEKLHPLKKENITSCSSSILNYIGDDLAQQCTKLSNEIINNKDTVELIHKSCQTIIENKLKISKIYSNTIAVNSNSEHSTTYKTPNLSRSCLNKSSNCSHSIQTIKENALNSIHYINDQNKTITVQYVNDSNNPSAYRDNKSDYKFVLQKYLNDNKTYSQSTIIENLKDTKIKFDKDKTKHNQIKKIILIPNKKDMDKNHKTEKCPIVYNKEHTNKHQKLKKENVKSNKNNNENKYRFCRSKNRRKSLNESKKSESKHKQQNSPSVTTNSTPNTENSSHYSKNLSNKSNISDPKKPNNECYRGILKSKIHNRSISSDMLLDEQYWRNCLDDCESTGKFGIWFSNHTIFKRDSYHSNNNSYIHNGKRTLSGYLFHTKSMKQNLYKSCFSLDNLKINCHVLLIRTWSGMWFKSKKPRFATWSTEEFTAFT